jgi:hypothetical protein
MFRLTRVDHPHHLLITIEGRLTRDSVEFAERTCEEALLTKVPVTIFLNNVLEIDVNGYTFLAKMVTKKARLRGVGLYSRYVVRRLQSKQCARD